MELDLSLCSSYSMSSVSYANMVANGTSSSSQVTSQDSSAQTSPSAVKPQLNGSENESNGDSLGEKSLGNGDAEPVKAGDAESGEVAESAESPVAPEGDEASGETSQDKTTKEKKAGKQKPKEKKLAPAPVPTTNVWGSSSPADSANVDLFKWPTPDQDAASKSKNNQKFIKPITNKWVPINAKLILPNNRSNNNPANNKKNNKNKNKTKNNNNNNNKNKPRAATQAPTGTKTPTQDQKIDEKKAEKLEKKDKTSTEDVTKLAEDLKETSITELGPESFESQPPSSQTSTPNQSQPQPHPNSNGHAHNNNNRQYRMNYRNMNRYSVPNNYNNGNFIPYPMQPYQSLPGGYYPPYLQVQAAQQQAYAAAQYQAQQPQLHPNYKSNSFSYSNTASPQAYGNPTGPNATANVPIPPPISPKQDPINALTQQIDYYFSFQNLIKDIYLRKNMHADTGFINLSIILNFKRVQIILNQIKGLNLSTEFNVTVFNAIKNCQNLEINLDQESDVDLNKVELRVKNNFQQWILD